MQPIDNYTRKTIIRQKWQGKLASAIELMLILLLFTGGFLYLAVGGDVSHGTEAQKQGLHLAFKLTLCVSVFFGLSFGGLTGISFFLYRFVKVTYRDYYFYLKLQSHNLETSIFNYTNRIDEFEIELKEINDKISEFKALQGQKKT